MDLEPAKRGKERFLLGTWYEMGTIWDKEGKTKINTEIIPKNHDQFLFWMQKSADDHYYLTHFVLSIIFRHGLGVEKSEPKSLEHALRAADLVSTHEFYSSGVYCNLQQHYRFGIGTKKDTGRADEYLELAKPFISREHLDLSKNPHLYAIFEHLRVSPEYYA